MITASFTPVKLSLILLFAIAAIAAFFGLRRWPDVHALDTPHKKLAADLRALDTQLHLYHSVNGFYPTTEQGLQALVTAPLTSPRPSPWSQLFRVLPKDPWGSDYVYIYPGKRRSDKYDLFSCGPDRTSYTADDDWGSYR